MASIPSLQQLASLALFNSHHNNFKQVSKISYTLEQLYLNLKSIKKYIDTIINIIFGYGGTIYGEFCRDYFVNKELSNIINISIGIIDMDSMYNYLCCSVTSKLHEITIARKHIGTPYKIPLFLDTFMEIFSEVVEVSIKIDDQVYIIKINCITHSYINSSDYIVMIPYNKIIVNKVTGKEIKFVDFNPITVYELDTWNLNVNTLYAESEKCLLTTSDKFNLDEITECIRNKEFYTKCNEIDVTNMILKGWKHMNPST